MATTHQIRYSTYARVLSRLEESKKIAAKLKVTAPTVTVVREYVAKETSEITGFEIDVPMVEIEVEEAKLCWDGWTFLAAVDHETGVVRSAPGAPEGLAVKYAGSEGICEHCGVSRDRKQTILVQHEDGGIIRVGGSCVKKFLGGFPTIGSALFDFFDDDLFADDDLEISHSRGEGIGTIDYLTVATAMIRVFGYEPSSFDLSTKERIAEFTKSRSRFSPDWLDQVSITQADYENAVAARAWAVAHDRSTDFGINLSLAAESDTVSKNRGILAFVPEGYARHLGREATRAAIAKVEEEAVTSPVPEGRVAVVGTVVKTYVKESEQYGNVQKMIVLDDRGFTVCGTIPSVIRYCVEAGVRVEFTATLTRSDDKDSFGFFSRPSKAEIREQ